MGAAHLAALKLLSRREFSAAEVALRLKERGFAEATVTELLDTLRAERMVDDDRYATQFVRVHAERGQGPRRIRRELSDAGVDESTIDRALDPSLEDAPDFHAIATSLRARRFGSDPPADWAEKARQSRFLQYRGFSNDHIASALGRSGAVTGDPDDPGSADPTSDDDFQ